METLPRVVVDGGGAGGMPDRGQRERAAGGGRTDRCGRGQHHPPAAVRRGGHGEVACAAGGRRSPPPTTPAFTGWPNLPPGIYSVSFERDGYFPSQRGGIALRSDATLRVNALMVLSDPEAEDIVADRPPDRRRRLEHQQHHPLVRDAQAGAGGRAGRQGRGLALVRIGRRGRPGAPARRLTASASAAPPRPENHYSVDGLSVGNPGKGIAGHAAVHRVRRGGQRRQRPATCPSSAARPAASSTSSPSRAPTSSTAGVLSYSRRARSKAKRSRRPDDAVARVTTSPSCRTSATSASTSAARSSRTSSGSTAASTSRTTSYNVTRSFHRTRGRPVSRRRRSTAQDFGAEGRTYQGMVKLTYSINADNRLTLSAFGTPTARAAAPSSTARTSRPGSYGIDPLSGRPEGGGNARPTAPAPTSSSPRPSTPRSSGTRSSWARSSLLDVMLGAHCQNDSRRAADGSTALSGHPPSSATTTTSTGGAANTDHDRH